MKSSKIFSIVVLLFFALALTLFAVSNNFSQSNQGKENPTSQTIQGMNEEDKSEEDSNLELFEYIEPIPVKAFLKRLNELGAKKYRLSDYTQIPFNITGRATPGLSVSLAAIVKLDETRYEYKIIDVAETKDLAETLNRESKEGFNLRRIIAYRSVVAYNWETATLLEPVLEHFTSPEHQNLILLERETDRKIEPHELRFTKADAGIGSKPTETMKSLLAEAGKENFYPVGIYLNLTRSKKRFSWSGFDLYYGIIVEKFNDKPESEFEVVRAYLPGTFKKRVNKLASTGYVMGDNGFTFSLMFKERETVSPMLPKSYQWLRADSKNFAADLSKLSNNGARLYGTELGFLGFSSDAIVENELIFEQTTIAENFYDYKVLPMVDDKPQPFLIGKTVVPGDNMMQKFRRTIKQGYSFSNLIYADETVTAVFERQRSKAN